MATLAASTKQQQLLDAKQRVRDAFVVFEHRDGSKMVDMREVPAIVRSLGVNPSTAQLQYLQQAITAAMLQGSSTGTGAAQQQPAPGSAGDTQVTTSSGSSTAAAAAPNAANSVGASAPASGGFVALEQCEGLIAAWLLEMRSSLVRDDFHLLMRAFQALDPDNRGWLNADQLKALLTACEDALTPEEANVMIDAAADNQGRINYQEFAQKLAMDGRDI